MANWCSNIIVFYGSRIDEVLNDFKGIEAKGEGQTFEYINNPHRYFFSVAVEGECVMMETKWAPPIEEIIQVCKNYGVTCKMYYEEMSNQVYGCLKWNGKEAQVWDLEDEDLKPLTWDDNGEPYWHGDPIDSEWDLYSGLLEEKISKG